MSSSFEALRALAEDHANAAIFISIARAARDHFQTKIVEVQDRILRIERFENGSTEDELRWLAIYQRAVEIAKLLEESLSLRNEGWPAVTVVGVISRVESMTEEEKRKLMGEVGDVEQL